MATYRSRRSLSSGSNSKVVVSTVSKSLILEDEALLAKYYYDMSHLNDRKLK